MNEPSITQLASQGLHQIVVTKQPKDRTLCSPAYQSPSVLTETVGIYFSDKM